MGAAIAMATETVCAGETESNRRPSGASPWGGTHYMNVYDSCDPILVQNFPSIRVEQWKGGSTLPTGMKTSWIMPCLT